MRADVHRLHANVTPYYMKGSSITDFDIPEVLEPDCHGSWKIPVHSKPSLTLPPKLNTPRWHRFPIPFPEHCPRMFLVYMQVNELRPSRNPQTSASTQCSPFLHFFLLPSRHCQSFHNPVSIDLTVSSDYNPYCVPRWIKSHFPGIQSSVALKQPASKKHPGAAVSLLHHYLMVPSFSRSTILTEFSFC